MVLSMCNESLDQNYDSLIIFCFDQLDDVTEIAVQHFADFRKDLCAYVLVLPQLGQRSGGHTGGRTEILFFKFLSIRSFHNLLQQAVIKTLYVLCLH